MNPRTIIWQALASGTTLVLLTVVGTASTAVGLSSTGLVATLLLNRQYAVALGSMGRSKRRISGDHFVAAETVVAFVVPGVVAIAFVAGNWGARTSVWDFNHTAIAALLTVAAGFAVVVMLSSFVDWYYIRPRIDGLVWDPPCTAKEDQKARWKRVTRRWYLHRGIAALAYLGFGLGIAIVVVIVLATRAPVAAGVVGGVSGIASVMLFFAGTYRSELPIVAKWVLSPAFYLGDEIRFFGLARLRHGYVLHVAVPVAKLVLFDEHDELTHRTAEPKNSEIAAGEVERSASTLCARGCRALNPECMHRETPENARKDCRRRPLVW